MAPTPMAPASLYRDKEGLGIWEHRGKVAAVGVGHSLTARRWDGSLETSVGANTIVAIQQALDDAGVSRDDVDGMVIVPDGTGDPWAPRQIPEDFVKAYQTTDNPEDGLTRMSAEWIVKNMGFKNIKTAYHAPTCMSKAMVAASQLVGDGEADVTLVVRVLNNLPGRYHHVGDNLLTTASGGNQWTNPWGWNAAGTGYAYLFEQYCRKYGSNHDRMAPFIVNQRRNGRMFPEGYYLSASGSTFDGCGLPGVALDS